MHTQRKQNLKLQFRVPHNFLSKHYPAPRTLKFLEAMCNENVLEGRSQQIRHGKMQGSSFLFSTELMVLYIIYCAAELKDSNACK